MAGATAQESLAAQRLRRERRPRNRTGGTRSLSFRGHLSHFPKLPARGGTAAPEEARLRPAPAERGPFFSSPALEAGAHTTNVPGTGERLWGRRASREGGRGFAGSASGILPLPFLTRVI